jgi:hypothetical protein
MMRKTFLSASLAAASLLAGLTACNNDKLTAVNANPNAPEHVQSSSLFTNATTSALSTIRGSTFEFGACSTIRGAVASRWVGLARDPSAGG